jgi:hypothetical protein
LQRPSPPHSPPGPADTDDGSALTARIDTAFVFTAPLAIGATDAE